MPEFAIVNDVDRFGAESLAQRVAIWLMRPIFKDTISFSYGDYSTTLQPDEFASSCRYSLTNKAIELHTVFAPKSVSTGECVKSICPYDKNNAHFLSIRNNSVGLFVVGYEPEFKPAAKPAAPKGGKRRAR